MKYRWKVFFVTHVGDRHYEEYIITIEADTADHACQIVSASKWIARTNLVAYPES